MSYDLLNRLLGILVMGSWALMMFLPRWRVTRAVLNSDVVPLLIGAIYLSIAVRYVPGWFGEFRDLQTIAAFMAKPDILFVGWIHYLAFDLFVGRSILRDAQERGISQWLVAPCLFMTFMFGPGGYFAYALVRLLAKRHLGAVNPLPAVSASSPLSTAAVAAH